jgi:glycosyltransferase involved in cell wall biosynthesis
LPTAVAAPSLRVALVGPVTPDLGGRTPGGVATHLVHLANGLAQAGVDAALLATNAPATTPRQWPPMGQPAPLYRTYVAETLADWVNPAYLAAVGPANVARYAARLRGYDDIEPLGSRKVALGNLLWYRRFLCTVRPQVLHVQLPLERHLYARLIRQYEGWRLPLVVTVHSFFQEHPDALIQGLMRPNLRHADRLIAVSRSTAAQAVELGADPDRLRVIRSGVDTQRFQPRDRAAARARLGLSPETPIILFVGNLEPRKAVDRLLHAFAQVRASLPGARLAVIGTGESAGAEDQTALLHQLAHDLSLARSVRFLGRVVESDLLDWYAAANVFALPSSSEAQGIVALEAMACGLPVVASAVGGLLDTIEDGRTGYLVPFGNVPVLAERLASVLSDPAAPAIGMAARRAVINDFSWERAVSATIEVYREVLA